MRFINNRELAAYALVSVLAVGGAFAISLKFIGSLRAQDAGGEAAPTSPTEPPADPGTDTGTEPGTEPTNPPSTGGEAAPPVDSMDNAAVPSKPITKGSPASRAAPAAGNGTAAKPKAAAPDSAGPSNALTSPSNSGIAELEGFLEPFIYDVANRRDPFLAFAEFIPSEEGPLRALTPAQRFALEELKLVGVMWEVKDPKAMFMDPDDEVLVLGRDESIGNRNGYIAAIREGEVVVVEAIRKRGDIIYRTRVLRIER